MQSVAEVNLDEVLGQETLVILEFHSPQCAHCKALAPALERLEEKFSGETRFVSVDIFEAGDVAGRYNVKSVPTLLFLKQGELREKVVGNTYEAIIEEKIKKFI